MPGPARRGGTRATAGGPGGGAPADLTLTVEAAGFELQSQGFTVPADARLVTNVDLIRKAEIADSMQITSPADGAVLGAASVEVLGYVAGLQPISVTVNGIDAQ